MKTFGLLIVLMALIAPAVAQDTPSMPVVDGGTKRKLTELLRSKTNPCSIYKLIIDGNTYLVNTCGGIVLAPNMADMVKQLRAITHE